MSQYYYTMASLPMLKVDAVPEINISSFLEICRTELSDKDWSLLQSCALDPAQIKDKGFPLLVKWKDWEVSLRNALVHQRSPFLGIDPKTYIRPGEDFLSSEDIAAEAMKADSPLEAEKLLSIARFEYIEYLTTGHYYDMSSLMGYYLQLMILERLFGFDTETGFSRYHIIYNTILGEVDG